MAMRLGFTVVLAGCVALSGCQPLALSMAGAGAAAAFGRTLSGISYRTFTAPLQSVKHASLKALEAMGIEVHALEPREGGEAILARAGERTVEISLEAISPRATQIRVATRNGGILYDGATAQEIVSQTEKALTALEPRLRLVRSDRRFALE